MLAKTTLYLDFSAPSRAKDSGEAGAEGVFLQVG